jgi:diadenosine tetraphosphate (Ap4A) HIT family hydrolase
MTTDQYNLCVRQECPFCVSFEYYLYRKMLPNYRPGELEICGTKNFVVLPDIAPLVEGHILIISREHHLSMGSCGLFDELVELKEHVQRMVSACYSQPIFFEHGSMKPKHCGSSIDHAHLHCLPLPIDLNKGIHSRLTRNTINRLHELDRYSERKQSYLYFENVAHVQYSYSLDGAESALPSQYLRQVIAVAAGLKNWNWHTIIGDPALRTWNVKAIIACIRKLRKCNKTKLVNEIEKREIF